MKLKTKFDSVVKIKKQQVEKIENDIKKINNSIKDLLQKIEELKTSLLSFTLPKSGTFHKIYQNDIEPSNPLIYFLINMPEMLLVLTLRVAIASLMYQ